MRKCPIELEVEVELLLVRFCDERRSYAMTCTVLSVSGLAHPLCCSLPSPSRQTTRREKHLEQQLLDLQLELVIVKASSQQGKLSLQRRHRVMHLLQLHCMYVCLVITYSKGKDQLCKVAENIFFPVPVRAWKFGLARRVRQSRPASIILYYYAII